MKTFYEYKIYFKPFNPDLLSGILWALDISGIVEEENFITVYAEKEIKNDLLDALEDAKKWGTIETYDMKSDEFEDKNWNEEWEKKFDVLEITENIVVKPTFRVYHNFQNKTVILIDPKMSFGTGEHETTRLIIKLLEKHINKGDEILDAGSGTGILSITAIKLGAKHATAFDVDEWCYVNGKENAELNKVTDKIDFIIGDISKVENRNFDLVLANINLHILLKIAEDLFTKTKESGKIILSGLLKVDEKKVVEKYSSLGLKPIEKIYENEWEAIVFEK